MSEVELIQRLLENEYKLKDPWKIPRGTGFVLPIVGVPPFQDRNYVLLEEVKDQVSLEDTGGIHGVNFTNKSGETVYVRKGTMLKGQGTQSRSPVSSIVLEPEPKIIKVEVNCIHASHSINSKGYFVAGGVTPHEVERSLGNQSDTWNSISSLSLASRIPETVYRYGAGMPHLSMSQAAISFDGIADDNLAGWSEAMDTIKDTVDDALKDIPGDYLNQIGIAVFDLNGVVGVEIFDHPDSWKAYSDSIVRSYSKTLTETSDLYEIKTDNAREHLMEFLGMFKESEKTMLSSNRVSAVWALKSDVGFGEVTKIYEKEIHLSLAKNDEEKTTESPSRGVRWGEHQTIFRAGSGFPQTNISDWSTRRGAYTLLNNLESQPQRFTELLNNMDVSRGTLSSRLDEASDMDLIRRTIREDNGSPVYALTDKGKEAKKGIKQHTVSS